VLTILSQSTNDRNRDMAYTRLRRRFPSWDQVAAAPVEEIEEAIRPGGISKVKSKRIQQVLRAVSEASPSAGSPALQAATNPPAGLPAVQAATNPPAGLPAVQAATNPPAGSPAGGISLDWLEHAPRQRVLDFLMSLPGVGRKTAACVMLFSYDEPEVPVDTHVYRVASRLALIRPGASFEEAHDELRALVDPKDAYEVHVNLLRHGRRLCTARQPLCGQCPLLSICPYGRALTSHRQATRKGHRSIP
jgi:endonuclease-3